MHRLNSLSRGFSLIELMITLVLGLIISGAIVQVLVSNQVTERLNRGIASAQESGRFIMTRLRNELLETGRYDSLDPNLERSVDVVPEAAFVQNHPIILPGDFPLQPVLGSTQGANGGDDVLVAGMQAGQDCRGYKLGYADTEQFYVVNRYFVEDNKLKCVGFDGRVLAGQKVAVGNNGDAAFTLLDDVYGFQVLYAIANAAITNDSSGRPVNYVTADNVAAQILAGGQVVAIQVAVLVKGESELYIDKVPTFKLLNEDSFSPTDHQLYKQFETTISFRNVKNFLRSNNQ
ncbi:PilW family protein [Neptunicella marina]|uniref:PilW family protein n=1 Tax=Neptunicella marina TaxID=2125989 RepID=A0A8J6M1H5_9ALTE|nr:PilW family protein [Neptunicella marina]MBC3765442.1 PilW family protein [Neptunicella marina]